MIQFYFKQQTLEVRNNRKWIDILVYLLGEYKFKDKYRSFGMTPSDVNKSNENLVVSTLFKQFNKERKSKIKFKFGDRVRITQYKSLLVTHLIVFKKRKIFN
jgi:hypothetical protein